MPRCYKCKEEKPVTEFYRSKRTHRGIDDYCKSCRKAVCRANYHRSEEVKETYKERTRQWGKNNQERRRVREREDYRLGKSKKYKIAGNHKRRAILAKVPSEFVDINLLYVRDKGVCGICKELVDRKDMSHDHIVPLSKGGHNTWANAQLTHLLCNLRKGSTLKGFRKD